MEAQSYRLTCEDAPSIDYMARFIAKTQQSYTQRGGVRPFGVSSMIAGFGADQSPQLLLTDPGGTYSSWKVFSYILYSCVELLLDIRFVMLFCCRQTVLAVETKRLCVSFWRKTGLQI